MRRTRRWLVCAVLLASLLVTPAAATEAAHHSSVVIVLAPYLSWDDLTGGHTPAMAALAARSALANVSVRNGAADDAPDGVFGAGVLSAMRPLSADEAGSIAPGAPFGTMAEVVRQAGGVTVAIGTAAPPGSDGVDGVAPALVVAGDTGGRLDIDVTGSRMLREERGRPLDVTVSLSAMEAAYRSARSVGRPLLAVIDAGETERARAASASAGDWEAMRVSSVRTTDELVGRIIRDLPADAALVVVSTAAYAGGDTPGFGPLIVYAAGPGVLESSATRRAGIVTLADVSATALDLLGLERPAGVAGVPLSIADADRGPAERIAAMRALDTRARSLEAIREPVWFGFLGVCVVVVLASLAVALLAAPAALPGVRRVLAGAFIALLAVPPGSLLALLGGAPSTPGEAWMGLTAGTVAVLAAVYAWPRRDPVHAFGRLVFITLAILLADRLIGGPLSNGTAFSYSTLFGARYYGIGNEGAAIGFGALLAGIGWRIDHYGLDRARGFLVAGALAIVIAVLPFLGANIGVAAWGAAAVVGGYLWASGRRLTWRVALAVGAAVVAIVGVAIVADALGAGSHLGGFVAAAEGGGAGLREMLLRKLEISLRAARATPLVALLPLGIGAMAYAVARPTGRIGDVLTANRGLAATWVATVAGALVAVVTEDSSVAIGALLMLYALAFFGVVALTAHGDGEGA